MVLHHEISIIKNQSKCQAGILEKGSSYEEAEYSISGRSYDSSMFCNPLILHDRRSYDLYQEDRRRKREPCSGSVRVAVCRGASYFHGNKREKAGRDGYREAES